jgi:single-strand DNA-binding protein
MDHIKIQVLGRVGKTPEMRYTPNGKAVTTFSVAVNRGSGDNQSTDWFNVECWEKTAEAANEYLGKGSRVFIEGTPKWNEWKDNDGNKRKDLRINAFTVISLTKLDDAQGRNIPQEVEEDAFA